MERILIHVVCKSNDDTRFTYTDESVYNELVSLGCRSEQFVTYDEKEGTITIERTVFVDEVITTSYEEEPIDLDIDDYIDIPGLGRVPNEVAPEGYVYVHGELTKVK